MSLSIRTLKVRFGNLVISYPDLTFLPKETCLVKGGSGTGKTTLLHLISGLRRPSEGQINLDAVAIHQLKGAELDHFRGQKMGLVFQTNHLLPTLTVKENLLAAQYFAGIGKDATAINSALVRLGLEAKLHAMPHTLSQGQAQRVAIARAVLHGPKLILADEPTASLDDENCTKVIELLQEETLRLGATLIVATHDSRIDHAADRIIHLD